MKTICQIHRFAYEGNKCPFCEKDRILKLVSYYQQTLSPKSKDNSIKESDLEKLREKYSNTHK